MNTLQFKMKPYIQPFEKKLALKELQVILGQSLDEKGDEQEKDCFYISSDVPIQKLVKKLAYWETIENNSLIYYTDQSKIEATTNVTRNGISLEELKNTLPFSTPPVLPNRRCLRYASHGIHEYRGKFFPQLVRSLINISGIEDGCTVADPMSGSGTTLIESIISNKKCLALDMNPLSVFIANVKAEVLTINPDILAHEYSLIRVAILNSPDKVNFSYFESLSKVDQVYLSSWFSKEVLSGLSDIVSYIGAVKDIRAKNLFLSSLSNIIRKVSWQKDADLRVRKDIQLDVDTDPKKEFLEELARSVRSILAFLYQNGPISNPVYQVAEGDARCSHNLWGKESVDLIITSPPYATALPYLDTDRLSLYFLGLLSRSEHRSRDQEMIGNREISERTRVEYMEQFILSKEKLPKRIYSLIDSIDNLNSKTDVGFRRKNLPALLSKYFFDMEKVLKGMYESLKHDSSAFVVVGNNHTVAGGNRIEIETADLLQEIAQQVGFIINDSIPMEMLISRDIHKNNAMNSEKILWLHKP